MKTILFLINGLGVEHKNSYPIYNNNLMPNYDKIKKNNLFQTLTTNANNYQEGYRNISLDVNEIYNYSIVEEDINNGELLKNEMVLDIKNKLEERKSKLHLFCLIDNSNKIIMQLKYILNIINPTLEKKIFLHLILTSNNIEDYPQIINILSKINLELGNIAKIGVIFGQEILANNNKEFDLNFFVKSLITEVGDKWQAFQQKLDINYSIKQPPNLAKPFVVNTGFGLVNNDIIMFFNYDQIDVSEFINLIKNINYGKEVNNINIYSLFPMTYKEYIPNLLNYQLPRNSLASNVNELGFNALILSNKNQINIINYYLNGLENVSNPKINYIEFDNYLYKPNELLSIINAYNHELIVINYNIDDIKTVDELKEKLHNIDIMLGNVYLDSKQKNYSLIISSLYGINKIIDNEKGDICNIVYHGEVPIIYVNSLITKKDYLIEKGNINDLMKICYKTINEKYSGTSIIVKKNFFRRLFSR